MIPYDALIAIWNVRKLLDDIWRHFLGITRINSWEKCLVAVSNADLRVIIPISMESSKTARHLTKPLSVHSERGLFVKWYYIGTTFCCSLSFWYCTRNRNAPRIQRILRALRIIKQQLSQLLFCCKSTNYSLPSQKNRPAVVTQRHENFNRQRARP